MERFSEIVTSFESVVQYMFFGHSHYDTFRLVRPPTIAASAGKLNELLDDLPPASAVGFVNPSLTPYRNILHPLFVPRNPAMRRYVITSNQQVWDFKQFYADLRSTFAGVWACVYVTVSLAPCTHHTPVNGRHPDPCRSQD